MAVEQDGKLVGNAEIGGAAPAVVDQARDVPFVVRAVTEGHRRAQAVIVAKTGLGDAAGVDRLLEGRITSDAPVEPILQRVEIALTGQFEVVRKIARTGKIKEIEILPEAVHALENLRPHV